jgi:hypothetical protein
MTLLLLSPDRQRLFKLQKKLKSGKLDFTARSTSKVECKLDRCAQAILPDFILD